ncbi:MAG: endonuclease/exonuclease/phosphatase family protein [Bacteroidota bacterium]
MKKIKTLLIALILTTAFLNAQSIKLMTYNIRLELASDGENDWNHRKLFFADQVKFYAPDIMGLQEAMPSQVNYLDTAIKYLKHVGIGREGVNKGEASSIFYNAAKYKLIVSKTFWLSQTPDTVSKGWDASFLRVCTYALFTDIKTNKSFWVFNTHLDNDGQIARENGVKMILDKIKEVNKKNLPVFFLGDFNSTPDNVVITNTKKLMSDSREVSIQKPFGPKGTFNGFNFTKTVTDRIDYIFVPKTGQVKVNKYAVLSDSDNLRYPSDHLPVFIEASFINP